ncbi:hypothetical protein LZ30DRAFT_741507 [Colletotrichum cereale]|nr:hypothetical protein LZ30DRAFT_741507 [Colletotrichum cereale]
MFVTHSLLFSNRPSRRSFLSRTKFSRNSTIRPIVWRSKTTDELSSSTSSEYIPAPTRSLSATSLIDSVAFFPIVLFLIGLALHRTSLTSSASSVSTLDAVPTTSDSASSVSSTLLSSDSPLGHSSSGTFIYGRVFKHFLLESYILKPKCFTPKHFILR